MTNDNEIRRKDSIKPIEERFTIALSELIGMCMDAGMHPTFMIEPLEKELRWIRETCARVDSESKPR